MKPHLIYIARDEVVLGQMPEADVADLLQAGLLLPTDDFWRGGMADWKALTEFMPRPPSWLAVAKTSLTFATSTMGTVMGKFAEQVKAAAEEGGEGMTNSKKKLLEGYLPQLKRTAAEKVGEPMLTKARGALHNDDLMKKVFGALYDFVPNPVQRFVAEKDFVEFCLEHRQKLLAKPEAAVKSDAGSL